MRETWKNSVEKHCWVQWRRAHNHQRYFGPSSVYINVYTHRYIYTHTHAPKKPSSQWLNYNSSQGPNDGVSRNLATCLCKITENVSDHRKWKPTPATRLWEGSPPLNSPPAQTQREFSQEQTVTFSTFIRKCDVNPHGCKTPLVAMKILPLMVDVGGRPSSSQTEGGWMPF